MTRRVICSLSPGIACGITGRSIVVPAPAVSADGPAFAVNASAPGISETAVVSIERIRACGRIERTNVACSVPGRLMSSPNVAVPVMKRGSSLRVTRLPRMLMGEDPTCPRNRPGGPGVHTMGRPHGAARRRSANGGVYEVKAVLASVAAALPIYQLVLISVGYGP